MSPAAGRARIVVFDPSVDADWIATFAAAMESPDIEFVVPTEPERADEDVRTADVVIATGRRRVTAEVIATLERAVGILCLSVGKDQVDPDAASAAGITVTNVPDYCSPEVADHALALLLAAERRLFPIVTATKAGVWNLYNTDDVNALRRLGDQTLGIIGAGRIGRLVAHRARAFGFTTIAYDPGPGGESSDELELVSLEELAMRSHALVLCAALTPQSRHIVGDAFLRQVTPGLILVNVARGGLVDEVALARALDNGVVAVAALDVRETEPPEGSTDLLTARPDVIVTPHVGGTSVEAFNDLLVQAAARSRDLLIAAGRLTPPDGARS